MEAPGSIMRALPGFDGMTVAFHELPKGTDFSPTKELDEVMGHISRVMAQIGG